MTRVQEFCVKCSNFGSINRHSSRATGVVHLFQTQVYPCLLYRLQNSHFFTFSYFCYFLSATSVAIISINNYPLFIIYCIRCIPFNTVQPLSFHLERWCSKKETNKDFASVGMITKTNQICIVFDDLHFLDLGIIIVGIYII